MTQRSAAEKETNTYFHINQTTPIGYNSSDGIVGGYDNALSEDGNPYNTSLEYDENMESGTITSRSKFKETAPQPTNEPTTCLTVIENAHEEAAGGGVWNQMGCGEWWKDNLPGALMAMVGAGMQLFQFKEKMKIRMNAKEWYKFTKKMQELDIVDKNGVPIRDFSNIEPEEMNKIMADPRNNRASQKFGELCEFDPDFKKYASDKFKIVRIQQDLSYTIKDLEDKLGPDFKTTLRNRLPGIDIDSMAADPNSKVSIAMNIDEYNNIDLDSDIRRTKFKPGLSVYEISEADTIRQTKLNEINSEFKGNIKSVDDVDFISKLPSDLPDADKVKIFNEFGINPGRDLETIKSDFSQKLRDFKANNIYPSYQTFDTGGQKPLPTSIGERKLADLKTRYDEMFAGDPDAKPFRGTSSISDMTQHPDFSEADFNNLKSSNFIDPNIEFELDGDKVKFKGTQPGRINQVPTRSLQKFDLNISNKKMEKFKSSKSGLTPDKKSLFDNMVKNDFKSIQIEIDADPNRMNKNIFDNLDLVDEKTWVKMKKLELLPSDYLKNPVGGVVRLEKEGAQIETGKSAKIGAGFDDGTLFNKAGLGELKSSLKMSVGIGAGLGVGMALGTKDLYDEDERDEFIMETSALLIGTVVAEVAEYVVERSLNSAGKYIGKTAAGKAAGGAVKGVAKGAIGVVKGIGKTALSPLTYAGRKAAQKGVGKAAGKVAGKLAGKAASAAGKVAGKLALKTAGKAVIGALSKLAAGPIGAVLLVVDIIGLILDLIDPCGFDSKIKLRETWEAEFQSYEEMHKMIMKSMGKSYPGQAKPDLLRYYTEYNPITGEAMQKMNRQDEREYNKYRDSYFEKCNLVTDASCRDNTFSSMATNAIRQGRMQAVNNLDTNMVNPYSVQPIIVDKVKIGDAALYSRVAISSNYQVLSAAIDTTRDIIDGKLVFKTQSIKSEKLELKPIRKLFSEEFNSKAIFYYVIAFLSIVIAIVLTLKTF